MKSRNEPVVVSGAGLICPLGQGVDTVWQRMLAGDAVSEPIPERWQDYATYQSSAWAPLPAVDYERYGLKPSDALRLDPVSMLSIGACHEALGRAGIGVVRQPGAGWARYRITDVDSARIGVFLGTGIGGVHTTLATHSFHSMASLRSALEEAVGEGGSCARTVAAHLDSIRLDRRFNPLAVTMLMPNAVSAAAAVRYGVTGPCRTTTLACASGTAAIGDAYRAVSRGVVDIALAGASEYLFDEYGSIFRAYDVTGATARGIADPALVNRPFDRARNGFLFSEGGAAVLVLERAGFATARGATPLAEIVGFAETFDGYNLIAMNEDGAQQRELLTLALADAGVTARDVGYVNAHGTGTVLNDAVECEAIASVLGDHVLINSTKSLIGHTIGASGAIEAVVTALSLRDGEVHPCRNLDAPMASLNFARTRQRADIEVAISESFAFGGHNACLVMRRTGQPGR